MEKGPLSRLWALLLPAIMLIIPSIAHADDDPMGETVRYLYLMGDFNSFLEPDPENVELYGDWAIPEVAPGVYEGTLVIPASRFDDGVTYFRLVTSLDGWDAANFLTTASSMLFNAEGTATSTLTAGSDDLSWLVNWSRDAEVTFRADLNAMTLTLSTDFSHRLRYLCLLGAADIEEPPVQANIERYKPWFLYERDGQEGVYEGRFEIPAGRFDLKILHELEETEDALVAIVPEGESVLVFDAHGMSEGSSADEWFSDASGWSFPDWEGGELTVTVDTRQGTVRFYAPLMTSAIYLIGDPNGNLAPVHDNIDLLRDWSIAATGPGSALYEGVLEFPEAADELSFRFYDRLNGWGYRGSYGPAYPYGTTVDFILTRAYSGIFFEGGEGCWRILNWPGGNVKFSVNLRAGFISMQRVQSGIDDLNPDDAAPVITAANGILTITALAPATVTVHTLQGVLLHTIDAPAGTTAIPLAPGLYIVNHRLLRL